MEMLAAATSFFARTAISQSYNIGSPGGPGGSRSSTPGPSGSSSAPIAFSPPLNVGLWRVQSASHKVTSKRVSVWSFDKRSSEIERLRPAAKERTLEILKAEASALTRLRHPSILEMVEPLEETRTELTFATEPILSSLELSIPGAGRRTPLVELDEVEIQKGILQICKGLSFLHSSAQLIHSNLGPESIIINSSGDWKIAGLGLTIPLMAPGGSGPTRWEFPTFDGHVPAYIQRSFDYMAPEYALDEQLVTASDMYSLGCLIYAVHCKGNTPFKNHGSLGGLRENAGKPPPNLESLDSDLQVLLRSLITRHAANRPTPTTLPTHPFFSSLPISTLNFLDRSNFTAKTREEKISFMKGLASVLDKFSEGLRSRKILPSLLEEMKDTNLLPYILPNVFAISTVLSPGQFANLVLPSLKPLFVVKEPPQNMLTLLDNLAMLQSKTDKAVFREQVMPLVYNALESDHAMVQERALQCVPDLCESIDYAEVQGVLFPRVAIVFTKTRVLTVKVATLTTFLTMVKTLDQTSLTQKLVPLLSKIRTKEPAVTMATLAVQEAMGLKVDREAVATLVLPQLWAISMGPLLSLDQFQRFMAVIRKLGDRVEEEHKQFLRDSQRLEDRSATAVNGAAGTVPAGGVDFASLVGRANGATVKADTPAETNVSWDDDPWASILNDNGPPVQTPPAFPAANTSTNSYQTHSLPASPQQPSFQPRPSRLGSSTVSPSSYAPFPPPTQRSPPAQRPSYTPTSTSQSTMSGFSQPAYSPPAAQSPKPNYNISLSPTAPAMSAFSQPAAYTPTQPLKPNYNLSLGTAAPTSPPLPSFASPMPPPINFSSSLAATQPAMGSLLAPSKPSQPSWSAKKPSQNDWGDFDPLA
ncbi:kinase-like domain-containing protein [Mycena albidolilacea]|uniref:Kinase-like domain-containing protein n=1 Tax=Mycena albidolilacea TaxID=1033008 RepID=A0AAD7A4D3_9AGAR|nr:kinase-like domain-containing protein [Mycena albidolilacea]